MEGYMQTFYDGVLFSSASVGKWPKEDRAKKLNSGAVAKMTSADCWGSCGTWVVLQSCPELRQGRWTFEFIINQLLDVGCPGVGMWCWMRQIPGVSRSIPRAGLSYKLPIANTARGGSRTWFPSISKGGIWADTPVFTTETQLLFKRSPFIYWSR